MSKQENTKEMVQRILAVAEILSSVATPEEIQTANQTTYPNIIMLAEQGEDLHPNRSTIQEVQE